MDFSGGGVGGGGQRLVSEDSDRERENIKDLIVLRSLKGSRERGGGGMERVLCFK